MAQLIVRNLDVEVVDALKRRAALAGRSAEEEHRQILRDTLIGLSFSDHVRALHRTDESNEAALFERSRDLPRSVEL